MRLRAKNRSRVLQEEDLNNYSRARCLASVKLSRDVKARWDTHHGMSVGNYLNNAQLVQTLLYCGIYTWILFDTFHQFPLFLYSITSITFSTLR
jgi:hypothetical protein